jgi:hypothetical protein
LPRPTERLARLAAVAVTALGPALAAPGAEPASRPQFTNVARAAGLVLPNVSGALDKTTINEGIGNGVCIHDVDDDGWSDVFLPNGLRPGGALDGAGPRSALYRNRGDGTFEDVTEKAGVAARGYWAQGCVFADYDDDGRVDLFLTGFGRYLLFRNLGGGRFQDVTAAAGLAGGRGWSTGAAFADYDGDGRIDLYVSHYVDYDASSPPLPLPGSAPHCFYKGVPVICGPRGLKPSAGRLYRNDGNGRFRDVSRAAGLRLGPVGYGLGAVWSDLDDDADLDLFVANDSLPNFLYRNDGAGRLAEVGVLAGAAYSEEGQTQAGMGVDAADYDNDGRIDLIVTNFSHDYSTLRHNEGDLFFLDVSMSAGVGAATLPTLGWGTGFLDYDNDGRKDLFLANGHVFPNIDRASLGTTWKQRNQLFLNVGKGLFREVTSGAGPAFQEVHSARGSALADLDNDGDVDIVVNNIDEPPSLLRNDGGNRAGEWIGLRLLGARRNRGAIGARVTVTAGALRQVAEIRAGSSHNSSSDPRLHFGLGSAAAADRVEIRWRAGKTQVLTGLPAGRYHTIREPDPARR